ncbi:adenylate kinase [bacterium]|nr:adenylate kinase [bacterium]
MRLIILGAPGSGKGTQAVRIKARYGLAHISTGDILRAEVAAGSELGRRAQAIMETGRLVGDDIVLAMVGKRLQQPDCERGWILDGFPRTRPQAEGLSRLLSAAESEVDLGLLIQVQPEEVVRRLSGRRVNRVSGRIYSREELDHLADPAGEIPAAGPAPDGGQFFQRDDDRAQTIRDRLAVYEEQTRPVIDYYENHDKVVRIDGAQPMEQVTDAIFSILRDRFGSSESA